MAFQSNRQVWFRVEKLALWSKVLVLRQITVLRSNLPRSALVGCDCFICGYLVFYFCILVFLQSLQNENVWKLLRCVAKLLMQSLIRQASLFIERNLKIQCNDMLTHYLHPVCKSCKVLKTTVHLLEYLEKLAQWVFKSLNCFFVKCFTMCFCWTLYYVPSCTPQKYQVIIIQPKF